MRVAADRFNSGVQLYPLQHAAALLRGPPATQHSTPAPPRPTPCALHSQAGAVPGVADSGWEGWGLGAGPRWGRMQGVAEGLRGWGAAGPSGLRTVGWGG